MERGLPCRSTRKLWETEDQVERVAKVNLLWPGRTRAEVKSAVVMSPLILRFAFSNDLEGIQRIGLRRDKSNHVAKRDDAVFVIVKILHILAKTLGWRVDPWMFVIRRAMKLEYGNSSIFCLINGSLKITKGPVRARVTRGRNV